MKPDRIFLVRHGQSVGNVSKEVYVNTPDYALELTEEGHKQATNLGKELVQLVGPNHPVQFYVSPFWRSRQTFLGIAHEFPERNVRYYEDPRLREQEWGNLRTEMWLQGKIEEDRDNYGHFYYRFQDGESCADVYDRVSDFMNTMFRDFEKKEYPRNVVIVSHGMTLRLFIMRWFHTSVEEFESWGNPPNCSYLLLERGENEKYVLTTPMKVHKLKHSYQFDWTRWTRKYTKLGQFKVPHKDLPQ